MDSKISMNSFRMKKDGLPDYVLDNYFVNQFLNNFLTFSINFKYL